MATWMMKTMMALGIASFPTLANAQQFALFTHSLGQIDGAGVPGWQVSPSLPTGRPGLTSIDRSFREALYEPLIREAEARYRLPPRLFQALVWAESRFDPLAISPAGAAGLAQLMPGTANDLGVTNRQDPNQNIDGGARYLRQMLDRFGAVHLALAAYNAGPSAVMKAGAIPKNHETPSYVRRIIARWMAYGSP